MWELRFLEPNCKGSFMSKTSEFALWDVGSSEEWTWMLAWSDGVFGQSL